MVRCICKEVWEDDEGNTHTACPGQEKWCEVEPGCDAAKEKSEDYDGWDECQPLKRARKDEL